MFGNSGNMMDPHKSGTYCVYLDSPILTNKEFAAIRKLDCRRMKSTVLSILFDPAEGTQGMRKALQALCEKRKKRRAPTIMCWFYPTVALMPIM